MAICLAIGSFSIKAAAPKGKITVSGVITDKNKEPLIGVSVII